MRSRTLKIIREAQSNNTARNETVNNNNHENTITSNSGEFNAPVSQTLQIQETTENPPPEKTEVNTDEDITVISQGGTISETLCNEMEYISNQKELVYKESNKSADTNNYAINVAIDSIGSQPVSASAALGKTEEVPEHAKQISSQDVENVHTFSDFDSDDSVRDPDYIDSDVNESDVESDIAGPETIEPEINSEAHEQETKGKKRQRTPKKWSKNVRRQLVLAGQEHPSKKRGSVPAKTLKIPCLNTCRLKCSETISPEQRHTIFKKFWSPSKNMNHKRQFVASHVKTNPISRERPVNGKREGKRTHSRSYFFEIDHNVQKVCKSFFINTLSISQTFVTTALQKKQEGGIIERDKRGTHTSHKKTPDFVKQSVRDHINRYPRAPAHYSRERTDRQYLGSHLNLARMYNMYRTECEEKNLPPEFIAKEWLYNEIFNTEFNLSFKVPDNDTCDTCDSFLINLRQTNSVDEKSKIQLEYDQHLAEASDRYNLKKVDKEAAVLNKEKCKFLCVDLQKCLPTPVLTNAQSFYSLKLWTYNYTIYDGSSRETTCIMWDESKANRGANEMASGLFKWAEINCNHSIEEITIWSDNCPSQNRNMIMVLCYFFLLKQIPSLQIINHKFLLKGHTHLEVDASHSIIEREKKKTPSFQIMTPWDWQQLARMASSSRPFTIINMEANDFKDFKSLYNSTTAPFVQRKKNSENNDMNISDIVHIQVRSEDNGVLYYKTDFHSPTFHKIDLNRSGRRIVFPECLPPVRPGQKPISRKKYEHLQKLLKWVPSIFHDFYKNLIVDDSVNDE